MRHRGRSEGGGEVDALHFRGVFRASVIRRRWIQQELRWNLYRYPDPDFDMPSTVPEHLAWLEEAGFERADLFWLKAGHAVYGGYKARVKNRTL